MVSSIGYFSFCLFLIFLFTLSCPAQEKKQISAEYGDGGLKLSTPDDRYSATIGFRFQLRAFYPYDRDPRTLEHFQATDKPSLIIRRARFKMDGTIYRPWFRYEFEYDFTGSGLYDIYFSFEKYKAFRIRFGQYKALYNRERVISSGKQLLVERSILNQIFTVDRQIGVSLSGNFGGKTIANFSYYGSVHTGVGSRGTLNDDDNLMYIGRIQWNFLGRETDINTPDSDYSNSQKPVAAAGFAASTNTSPYNRFSSGSGGGLLDGYDEQNPGQYRVDQYVQDIIFKYRGLSLLQEYHYKRVKDRVNDTSTGMRGFLSQAGIFPGYLMKRLPDQLQLAFRYARLDEDIRDDDHVRNEYTAGINWYFTGFNNRLSLDFSHLDLSLPEETEQAKRVRLQWDVTF